MISTFTAFFDANVFFGARLRSLIVELAQSGQFRARWSEDIHREWMGAVARKRPDIEPAALARVKAEMNAAIPGCVTRGYEDLVETLTLPDPADRHVVAAAIVAQASVIVTFNEADFPAEVLAPFGMHTRHPDEFILDVESLDSALFLEAVSFDIGHYRNPPVSLADYCAALRKAGVPQTADLIEQISILFESPYPPAP